MDISYGMFLVLICVILIVHVLKKYYYYQRHTFIIIVDDDAIYYQRRRSRRKKKSILLSPCKTQPHFPLNDPEAKTKTSFPSYNSTPNKQKPIQTCRQQVGFISGAQPLSCMMFSSISTSYQEQFPSLEKMTNP